MFEHKGFSHVVVAMAIVFISTFSLFYIFNSMGKIAESCSKGEITTPCAHLNSTSMSIFFIILIIAGFILLITAVAYIMLSAK